MRKNSKFTWLYFHTNRISYILGKKNIIFLTCEFSIILHVFSTVKLFMALDCEICVILQKNYLLPCSKVQNYKMGISLTFFLVNFYPFGFSLFHRNQEVATIRISPKLFSKYIHDSIFKFWQFSVCPGFLSSKKSGSSNSQIKRML